MPSNIPQIYDMTVNNHHSPFITKKAPSLFSLNPLGLQKPTFLRQNNTFITTTTPIKKNSIELPPPTIIQQAIYVSLSVLMRCGLISQLVDNWLCNPMEQLKRNTAASLLKKQRDRSSSSLRIMPSPLLPPPKEEYFGTLSVVNNSSGVPIPLFIHFQCHHIPCLFTIVYVTYCGGSVSLSIDQIKSLDFLLSGQQQDAQFMITYDLLPATIHQPISAAAHHQICDFPANNAVVSSLFELQKQDMPAIIQYLQHEPYILKQDETKQILSLLIQESHMLCQEEDDELCLLYSSEEYFILDDIDTEDGQEGEEDALLRLVQDTLQYIQQFGAVSDGLNQLEYKLNNYCIIK